jgi:hypothetical protein
MRAFVEAAVLPNVTEWEKDHDTIPRATYEQAKSPFSAMYLFTFEKLIWTECNNLCIQPLHPRNTRIDLAGRIYSEYTKVISTNNPISKLRQAQFQEHTILHLPHEAYKQTGH